MLVNPKIRELLTEIAKESVRYGDTQKEQYRYIRRFLKLFDEHLTQEERIFFISSVLEFVHYKNVATDAEILSTGVDLRLKYVFGTALSVCLCILVAAAVFRTNGSINGLIDSLMDFTKLLNL